MISQRKSQNLQGPVRLPLGLFPSVCKESACNVGYPGLIPGSGRSPGKGNGLYFHSSLSCTGEGNGNPLQCSCLENPRDGGAWWAAVYGVSQSRTRLKWLSSSSSSPLQYSCLGILMDRGRATVHGVTRVRQGLVTQPPPQGPVWLLHPSFCLSDPASTTLHFLCFSHTALLVIPNTNLAGSCLRALALTIWNLTEITLLSVRLSLGTLSGTATSIPSFSFLPSTFHCILLIYLTLLAALSPEYKLHEGKDVYSFCISSTLTSLTFIQVLILSSLYLAFSWVLNIWQALFYVCCMLKNSELSITIVSILQIITLGPHLRELNWDVSL